MTLHQKTLSVPDGYRIEAYPDLAALPEPALMQLAAKEREWWGYKPFGEYAICRDLRCRAVHSIDELYGVNTRDRYQPLTTLEDEHPTLSTCHQCGHEMELLFPPDAFLECTRQYIASGVFGAILFDGQGDVQGATSAFRDTRLRVLNAINYRQGYNVADIIRTLESALGYDADGRSELVCLNKVAIAPHLRSQRCYPLLTQAVLDTHPEYDTSPVLIDTRYDSRAYHLLIGMGYVELDHDQHGGVLMLHKAYGAMRHLISMDTASVSVPTIHTHNSASTVHTADRRQYRNLRLLKCMTQDHPTTESEHAPGHFLESLRSVDLSQETVREMSDFFRYIFCNSFGQYLLYPSIGQPIDPKEVFPHQSGYIPLSQLDGYNPALFPSHPVTGESAIFWHHPEQTFRVFLDKLSREADIALLRSHADNSIKGMMFGYLTTVRKAFELEEWGNQHLYAGIETPRQIDLDAVTHQINTLLHAAGKCENGLEYAPDSTTYIWNTFTIDPALHTKGVSMELASRFFRSIPDYIIQDLIQIGEPQFGSKAHAILKSAGGMDLPGVLTPHTDLQPRDPFLLIARMNDFYRHFTKSA